MIYSNDDMIKLIYDTKAVSIWNRQTGPVFWYAASVPGPFYVNTELVIGKNLAEELLTKITDIIATTTDLADRAKQLNQLILAAHANSSVYQNVIDTMVVAADKECPRNNYAMVSGGERRDWLFSIPFAKVCDIKHAFLFKNMEIFCEQPLSAGETTLHVADLINYAASYFDLWLSTLAKAQIKCNGTVVVNTRGTNGLQRLEANGQKIVALNNIDLDFFEQSASNGLIDRETLEEIAIYFVSAKDWAAKYLIGRSDLFDVKTTDRKSFERLQSFFTNDPWDLRTEHSVFFAKMQEAIATKTKAA